MKAIAWVSMMVLLSGTLLFAQTREERLYQIKLRRAEVDVEEARVWMEEQRRKHEETQQLFEEGLVTLQEANRAERDYEHANLLYERQKISLERLTLAFLEDALHLTIISARTYRTPDGRKMVDVALKNASDLERAMSLYPERLKEEVVPLLEIQQIIVSLTSGGGGVVGSRTVGVATSSPIVRERATPETQRGRMSDDPSQGGRETPNPQPPLQGIEGPPSTASEGGLLVAEPYEVLIPSLRWGEVKTLTFRLLRDLDEVGVAMRFLQHRQTQTIVLKKDSMQDVPTMASAQFSQEGELNAKVTYDLSLERLAEDEKSFRLAVLNLPAELDATFLDPVTGASLTQVKFTETVTKLQLDLQIAIPEKLSREFIDQTIEFAVLVTDEAGFRTLGEMRRRYGEGRLAPPEAIAHLPGEKVILELIPRGKAAVEVLIANRYEEIKVGDEAALGLGIQNTGTLSVEEVQLDLRLPPGWEGRMKPGQIGELSAGEKKPVSLIVIPPGKIGVGEYEIEVKVTGKAGQKTIESVEQVVTIRVGARARVAWNVVVIAGLIAVVLGLVTVTVKVSRR